MYLKRLQRRLRSVSAVCPCCWRPPVRNSGAFPACGQDSEREAIAKRGGRVPNLLGRVFFRSSYGAGSKGVSEVSHKKETENGNCRSFRRRKLLKQFRQAEAELENRRNYFDMVSEPGLVDEAVYMLLAAEKRYTRLRRQLEEEGFYPTRVEKNEITP